MRYDTFNSSKLRDACMRQWTRATLAKKWQGTEETVTRTNAWNINGKIMDCLYSYCEKKYIFKMLVIWSDQFLAVSTNLCQRD